MKLKLKESIRINADLHVPPSVIDAEEVGIGQEYADELVARGVVEVVVDEAPAETDEEREAREAAEREAAEKAAAEAAAASAPTAEPPSVTAPAPAAKTARARK